jgi:hypothetical protein
VSSFKDAAASIRRTTTEYNYQLVVQRAYEEGEEQLLESDDDELDDGMPLIFDARLVLARLTYCSR